MAVEPYIPADYDAVTPISEHIFKVSDMLLSYLSVLDIMHLRMVCKSTA